MFFVPVMSFDIFFNQHFMHSEYGQGVMALSPHSGHRPLALRPADNSFWLSLDFPHPGQRPRSVRFWIVVGAIIGSHPPLYFEGILQPQNSACQLLFWRNPACKMFLAAFTSRSATQPQKGHRWVRTERLFCTICPHR